MAIISLRQLLDHAAENNYGVPAFNVNNLEQIRAIMEGAAEMNSPVIIQASAGARKYAGPRFIKSMMEAAVEEFPSIPIVMHQDHGGSSKDCKTCIDLGFFDMNYMNFCVLMHIKCHRNSTGITCI